jgi:hypothetical protein
MAKGRRILIVSYYANMPGACQAEWVDDKIKSLLEKEHEITVISAICANPYQHPKIKHIRVPSISLHDFKDEVIRCKDVGLGLSWYLYLVIPIIYTLGIMIDWIQGFVTKGIGEGKWSWILSSFVAEFLIVLRHKTDSILSTGGPASAHVSSILVSKIFGKSLVIELQDPLSGGDIGRNQAARGWLCRIEKFIVKNATKTVYVTKAAAEFAEQQFHSSRIEAIYPGAWDFKISPSNFSRPNTGRYRLIHLGSLYATRTFKTIISALDLLIARGVFQETEIELLNLGHVAPEIRAEICQKSYVKISPPVGREKALRLAASYDIMLLIQNKDERSQVTIPYKTYDYLNLNNKVLGLLNSSELTQLLLEAGQMACTLEDIEGVAKILESTLKREKTLQIKGTKIDPVIQAEKLMTLVS